MGPSLFLEVSMRKFLIGVSMVLLLLTTVMQGASMTTLNVLPAMVSNTVGVALDAAPGFPYGSLKANALGKSEAYVTPNYLFGREIALGEIADVSYYTKKASDHVTSPGDWYLLIYTKPYIGDVSSATWYGDRINTEPYFAQNLTETPGDWNQWSATDTANRLRFYESTLGYFGSYTDPDLATFLAGNAISGQPYATREVLYISLQTASNWAVGFEGQVDGIRIELTDGTVVKLNLEPFVVPADRDDCKKDGWINLFRPDGSTFGNQGACVSHVMTRR